MLSTKLCDVLDLDLLRECLFGRLIYIIQINEAFCTNHHQKCQLFVIVKSVITCKDDHCVVPVCHCFIFCGIVLNVMPYKCTLFTKKKFPYYT